MQTLVPFQSGSKVRPVATFLKDPKVLYKMRR